MVTYSKKSSFLRFWDLANENLNEQIQYNEEKKLNSNKPTNSLLTVSGTGSQGAGASGILNTSKNSGPGEKQYDS